MSCESKFFRIMNYKTNTKSYKICYKEMKHKFASTLEQMMIYIGKIEQEFKLYIDTMKQQYTQSENGRIQLLENSKAMIKQLKMENEKLVEKIKQLGGGDFKLKQSSKKNISTLSHYKDRIRTDYSISEQVNNKSRINTQHTYNSPVKDKFKRSDFKTELTERQQNSRKKKYTEYKKKQHQNYTIMTYIGQTKKRRSKDKNNLKKALLSFSDNKKNIGNQFKDRQQSQKKVHKSYYSLASLDNARQQKKITHQKKKVESTQPIFYFSPTNNHNKKKPLKFYNK